MLNILGGGGIPGDNESMYSVSSMLIYNYLIYRFSGVVLRLHGRDLYRSEGSRHTVYTGHRRGARCFIIFMNERGRGPSSVIGHGTVVGWSRHGSGVALHRVLLNEK